MNRILHLLMPLLCCLLVFSCTKDESNPTQSQIPTTEWRTVFFDDFNRANTDNGDLGSDWTVYNATNGSIMQITNNEVHAEREVPAFGAPEICPYALYFQDVNDSSMRVSVKVRTGSNVDSSIIVLLAKADTNLSDGYTIGNRSFGEFNMCRIKGGTKYIWTGRLSANTTYILEIVTDSTGFEAMIKDYATGYRLFGGHITDEGLVSGKIGFMAGAPFPNVMYVDEFKIETLE